MRVDASNPDTQVLILATSRELIRQTMQVLQQLSIGMNIKIEFGEGSLVKPCHILVTTPNYFSNKLGGRQSVINFRSLKMVIFDEADEIVKQESNRQVLQLLKDREISR